MKQCHFDRCKAEWRNLKAEGEWRNHDKKNVALNVTIQLTTDLPDAYVGKCSLTAVSCAFPSRLKAPTVGGLEQISGNLNRYESIYNYAE